ncbi:cation:proton antiporter [Rhabdobacter roseus]|uniref:CPA2 family monovalent cation:H+ antiporter-2 n=1 Tax=Rhabdobacter roseus TaxID=1655419 RepID=A0A840TKK8_9BACT|nr:cation:proton antiporter [Rhabdobacter roseus]MBB5283944.1 CPA2 family monovalent cation:H+ antiporter-2 [Rhabdobacter roseus]
MNHIPHLIVDLALILGAAGITTILFKRLKQPLVLGYLLAGLLVGPNFPLFPSVVETESIQIWAEIGVIFLLFNLGLEFSFKKLVKVGSTAAISGLFEVSFMLLSGYTAGQLMGWSHLDSLFLGGIISISSTTIIIRAFEELGVKSQQFASVVMGILVIEDLVAVLLMVLLSTLAVSQQFEGIEMLASVAKLVFFLILWFLGGIFIFPSFIKSFRRYMNDETVMITSIALCFLMVTIATQAGFSAALGAFIMGSILAETTQAEKIEHLLKPVKDLFGAIFFVSVGMLIVPSLMVQYAVPLLILVVVVIVGKTLFASVGSLIAGQPLRSSIQAGLSLSQIGEFSFIIANLGIALRVTSDFLYPIAVGVSVITTFTTPYCIKAAVPLYEWIKERMPTKWYNFLNRYSNTTQTIRTHSHWNDVLKDYLQVIVLNSVVIIALLLLASRALLPLVQRRMPDPLLGGVLTSAMALLAMAPFLWALVFKRSHRSSYKALWIDRKFNRGPLLLLELLRVTLAVVFVSILLSTFFTVKMALVIAALIIIPSFALFYQKLQRFYNRIETRFIENLNAREQSQSTLTLPPWDAHLAFFQISADSPLIGQSLQELKLREKYGINVVLIERGSKRILLPKPTDRLFPSDRIEVIGTDSQLQRFKDLVEQRRVSEGNKYLGEESPIALEHIEIRGGHSFVGKNIRESQIRELTNGLVVGLEREGHRILNPESSEVIQAGDILWIAGHKKYIREVFQAS